MNSVEDKTCDIFKFPILEKSISIGEDITIITHQYKSVKDKTWDIFKFQILEKSISIREDRT